MRSERPNPVGVRILAGAKVRGGFTCRRHDILERRKVFVSVRVGFAMQEPRQPRPQDWNRMGACEFWIVQCHVPLLCPSGIFGLYTLYSGVGVGVVLEYGQKWQACPWGWVGRGGGVVINMSSQDVCVFKASCPHYRGRSCVGLGTTL